MVGNSGPERSTERRDEPAVLGLQRDSFMARAQSRLAYAAIPHVQAGNRCWRQRAQGASMERRSIS
jgi:hypothetical protein